MTVNEPGSQDILASCKKHKRSILFTTIFGAVIGLVFALVTPQKYKGITDFVVRNPLYGERGNLYSNGDRFLDYFANEDDLDKMILLSKSDAVLQPVIRKMGLAAAYHLDTSTKKGSRTLEHKVRTRLTLIRNEYRGLTLIYVDTDPDRAARVANETVRQLDAAMSGFYRDMRVNAYNTILAKIREEDSAINVITDTLAQLRQQYGIYDIISPSRHNIMLSTVKGNGKAGFGKAIEQIQNIESVKDEIVAHRALQITQASQHAAAINNAQMTLVEVITPAKNNMAPMLNAPFIVVICGLISGFFSILVAVIKDRRSATAAITQTA